MEIKQENQTLATITLQNYFRLYDKLAGMTGTAQTEAGEFNKVYKVGVVTIPTHRPMIREDRADVIYKTEQAKFNAVIEDIAERHQAGQPVLVGTVSVENSEILARLLTRRGIPHSVLNAKFHAREAEIVAQAGRKGAVTVATNMAGRGTDILLGGNPEFLAANELRQRGLDPLEHAEEYDKALEEVLPKWKQACDAEAEEVAAAGGLYVLGTERHESRRIDNQLRGRSGRQGDPGESRFYLSLQDELMKRFRSGAVEAVMDRFNIPEDVPIESKMVTRQIKSAQAQIEGQNAEIRKNVLKYDEVMNKQRQVIYAERLRVLNGEDLSDQVRNMIDDTIEAYVRGPPRTATPRIGILSSSGPASSSSTRWASPLRSWRRKPAGPGPASTPTSCSPGSRRTRTPRTTGVRSSSAPRAPASWSGWCCSRSSTVSGVSTSTRWTTSRRASRCERTPSATRWWSTSAKASTCSPP
ncbi:hypothetical protein GCM10029963_36230 [Micromonospora andamanensis]